MMATNCMPPPPCQICGVPTGHGMRCGAKACEACIKFYQRNHGKTRFLRCASGTNNCLLMAGAVGRPAVLTSAGSILRLTCTRCRLAKCIEAGMRAPKRIRTAKAKQFRLDRKTSYSSDERSIASPKLNIWIPSSEEYTMMRHLLLLREHPSVSQDIPLIDEVSRELGRIDEQLIRDQVDPNSSHLAIQRQMRFAQIIRMLQA